MLRCGSRRSDVDERILRVDEIDSISFEIVVTSVCSRSCEKPLFLWTFAIRIGRAGSRALPANGALSTTAFDAQPGVSTIWDRGCGPELRFLG